MHPRKFVRDSLGTAASQYRARAVLLLRGVVAAAALGPLGYGAWNALNLLLDYGTYASCGALQGLDLRLPAAAERGERARARRLMAGAWAVVVAGGVAFALATLVYLATGHHRIETPWGAWAPLLMLAAALLQLAVLYHVSALRAHGEFPRASAALGAQAVLGGGLGLALVGSHGVWGLLGGWLAGTLAALMWMGRSPVRPPLVPAGPREGLLLARLGLPVFAFFTASLVLRSVDRLAFVRYAGNEGLGLYSLGLMAAGLILYLPESAATVLYPRVSAAAQGARDRARTVAEVRQAQRAIAVTLPPVVALGMIWAGPATAWLLPAFGEGVPALRLLACGALLLGCGTLPGYFVLAHGPRGRLLAMGAGVALLTAGAVFAVAARDHRPASIATAAASGYAAFAAGLTALAARGLCSGAVERLRFAASSFIPAVWAGGLALASCAVGPADSAAGAGLRTAAVLAGYLPVLWWFGRGVGLRRLAREWWAGRAAPA